MNRLAIEYLTDGNGNQTAVVIPIELWRNILLQDTDSIETIKKY